MYVMFIPYLISYTCYFRFLICIGFYVHFLFCPIYHQLESGLIKIMFGVADAIMFVEHVALSAHQSFVTPVILSNRFVYCKLRSQLILLYEWPTCNVSSARSIVRSLAISRRSYATQQTSSFNLRIQLILSI